MALEIQLGVSQMLRRALLLNCAPSPQNYINNLYGTQWGKCCNGHLRAIPLVELVLSDCCCFINNRANPLFEYCSVFSSTMMLEIVLYPLLIWAVLDYVANCEPFKASYHVGKVAPWVKVVATQAWWTWALFLNPKLKERTDFQKLLSDLYMACVCSPQSNALSDLWAPYTCRYTHAWK